MKTENIGSKLLDEQATENNNVASRAQNKKSL